MIREVIDELVELLEAEGMYATADARNIQAPGCFVTVTRLERPTLGDAWKITGDILAIARDLGGMTDVDNISALVDDVLDTLDDTAGVVVESIDTNQQATPPTGGTLPAARLTFSVYTDRTLNNGD